MFSSLSLHLDCVFMVTMDSLKWGHMHTRVDIRLDEDFLELPTLMQTLNKRQTERIPGPDFGRDYHAPVTSV